MRSAVELCLYIVKAIALFCLAELPLHLVAFVVFLFSFPFFVHGLGRPFSLRGDGHPYAPFGAPFPVGVGTVDFVDLYQFRVMSVEFPVGFGMRHQVGTFVVGIPAQGLRLCEPVGMGKPDLGAELDLLARLSPDDGPHIGLGDAHYPVVAPVGPVGIHFPLLVVDGAHHPKIPHRFMRQRVFPDKVQHRIDTSDVAVKAVQVVADRAPERLFVRLSFLGLGKVFLAGHFSIGPWLDLQFVPQMPEENVDDGFRPFPGRVEQAKVVGVGNVLVGDRRVELQLALVSLAPAFPTTMADSGQYVREAVEGVVAEPLPPFHEKGWGEQRFGGELVEPQEELHVGVLLDDPYRLPVTKVQLVLYDKAADDDARGYRGPAGIGEVPCVYPGAPVPWKVERQTYPTVVRVQFHLVKIAEFLNFELVLRGVLYHMQSISIKIQNTLYKNNDKINIIY